VTPRAEPDEPDPAGAAEPGLLRVADRCAVLGQDRSDDPPPAFAPESFGEPRLTGDREAATAVARRREAVVVVDVSVLEREHEIEVLHPRRAGGDPPDGDELTVQPGPEAPVARVEAGARLLLVPGAEPPVLRKPALIEPAEGEPGAAGGGTGDPPSSSSKIRSRR
jgi:hypothetical protein